MEKSNSYHSSPKKIIFEKKLEINERTQKKMKNYKISSFNFILDENKDDSSIKEISENEKNKELLTTENDRNIVKHIYKKGNKKEEMWVLYDDDIIKNEEKEKEKEKEKVNENTLLNKKTKTMEIGTQTEEIKNSNSNNNSKNDKKNEMKAKLKILRLIEKYSYQFIFNFLLKYCSQNYIDNYINFLYYKDINEEIIELIKEVGIQKILSILLLIGNLRGEQINYIINQKKGNKDDNKNEEIMILDNKKDNNNNIINLEENNIEIIDDMDDNNNFEIEKEEDRKICLIDNNNKEIEKYDKYINDNSIKLDKKNSSSFIIENENEIKDYYSDNNKIYSVYYEKEKEKENGSSNGNIIEEKNKIIILDENNEQEDNIKEITMNDYNDEQNIKKEDKINKIEIQRKVGNMIQPKFIIY